MYAWLISSSSVNSDLLISAFNFVSQLVKPDPLSFFFLDLGDNMIKALPESRYRN